QNRPRLRHNFADDRLIVLLLLSQPRRPQLVFRQSNVSSASGKDEIGRPAIQLHMRFARDMAKRMSSVIFRIPRHWQSMGRRRVSTKNKRGGSDGPRTHHVKYYTPRDAFVSCFLDGIRLRAGWEV